MNNELKKILDKLKESVDNPIIDVPTYDGSDSEPMDNIAIIKPNACKQILDYITNLQAIADNRFNTILKIEKYCIDEKEDLISGGEVCEDILKIIDEIKGDSNEQRRINKKRN